MEGLVDLAVITRVLQSVSIHQNQIRRRTSSGGKSRILQKLHGYNQAAKFADWLILLDLDQDDECAPGYLRSVLPAPSTGMMLRIPVREIETWLLADQEKMANFLGINSANFPDNPESLNDPKGFLIDLVNRKCPQRYRQLRKDLLPVPESAKVVGPYYPDRIASFAEKHWRAEVAAERSDSLARCIRALEELKRQSVQ
ncbi:MAG: hypothetical protein OXP68_01255 [Anaerolineaceae bacterium]|nr:hypothetical protein [Anaerolineaceae bacterium]MDE0328719.1 hypothetical protein [Anaerolineaceae bacterium]